MDSKSSVGIDFSKMLQQNNVPLTNQRSNATITHLINYTESEAGRHGIEGVVIISGTAEIIAKKGVFAAP
jgi:hypothetical protein